MVLDSYRIYKYNDEYKITVTFVGDSDGEESGFSKYFYCTLDGKTGYIEGVNNRIAMPLGEKTALNEEEVAELNINNEDFLKKYLEDFSGYVMTEQTGSKDENGNITVSETYTKEIDGVPFINDTVTISYSEDKENVYYINGIRPEIPAEIPPVEQAVSEEEMYSTLMEKCPVTQVYIYDGEKYVTAYTMDTGIIYVNALTNQIVNYNNKPITDEKSYEYTDIDGHWAEDTIKLFAERQMSFPGDTFRPEESITTGDFYRLMTAVSRGSNTCFDMTDEEIIPDIADMLGIDKNGVDTSAPVTREIAAKMLIVEIGYGDVAELEDIFVCDFADADEISPDNIGYCALAQGFGIINGEYGYFYPANNITRAEALTMLYNAIDLI